MSPALGLLTVVAVCVVVGAVAALILVSWSYK